MDDQLTYLNGQRIVLETDLSFLYDVLLAAHNRCVETVAEECYPHEHRKRAAQMADRTEPLLAALGNLMRDPADA